MSPFCRAVFAAVLLVSVSPAGVMAQASTTPIEHVIVIVGENHTFDNVFGAYLPRPGQTLLNLRSRDIIDDDGKPGRNFVLARQRTADSKGAYSLNPTRTGAYSKLPQPNTTYATGQPGNVPDPRFPADLGNGPFQLSRYMAYSDFPGDPVHRFFQMWQQVGDNNKKDLFVWVAETAGIGNHNDGFGTIVDYLTTLKVKPNCAASTYYLVNNYNLGYKPDGTLSNPSNDPTKFTMPPQPVGLPTIADALSAKGVSWKWYSGGRGTNGSPTAADYCGICDPLTGFTSIMTTSLKNNLQDVDNLYDDIKGGTVPAVAFVRPLEQLAGQPANMVHDQPDLWNKTAILITYDEGGGYYDTGYIQPVDFFGDGTRIPLIAVSPYAKKGFVDHTYYDHVSVLKFIERNWGLNPLSSRSRDNLPNPVQPAGTYVPINGPAIGNLMNLFNFAKFRPNAGDHPDRQRSGQRRLRLSLPEGVHPRSAATTVSRVWKNSSASERLAETRSLWRPLWTMNSTGRPGAGAVLTMR
jgi:phospholipase C